MIISLMTEIGVCKRTVEDCWVAGWLQLGGGRIKRNQLCECCS